MTNLKFGYENEYFTKKDGQIIDLGSFGALPMDDAGWLVEVRSDPHENPFEVLKSFHSKYRELTRLVGKHGCTLANLDSCPRFWQETAGFHIHFSSDEWKGLYPKYTEKRPGQPPTDVQAWIERLDKVFKDLVRPMGTPPDWWRPKPYGWEYRRLSATVDPSIVTQRLAEEFWEGYQKAA